MGFLSHITSWLHERFESRTLHIVGILLIALTLPLTVFLAMQTQQLRQRASESEFVRFTDASGIPLPGKITDPNVYLYIKLPSDWTVSATQSNVAPKNKRPFAVFAQEGECDLAALGSTTKCQQTVYDTCGGYFCASDGQAHFKCHDNEFPLCEGEYICDPQTASACGVKTPTPTPTRAPTPTPQTQTPVKPVTQSASCTSLNLSPSQVQRGQTIDLTTTYNGNPSRIKIFVADNSNTGITDVNRVGSWTEAVSDSVSGGGVKTMRMATEQFADGAHLVTAQLLDGNGNVLDEKRCNTTLTIGSSASAPNQPSSTDTPTQSPEGPTTPPQKILKSLTIENKDTDGSSKGDDPRTITANFGEVLNKPIYWKLNGLKSDQNESTRNIQVTLSDGTMSFPITTTITLAKTISTPAQGLPLIGGQDLQNTSVQELTNRLNKANTSYNQKGLLSTGILSTTIEEVTAVAQVRKEKLLEELEDNPQAFLEHANLYSQRAEFPQEVQSYIEREARVEGEAQVVVIEDYDNKRSDLTYGVASDSEIFSLHPVDENSLVDLTTGSRVVASGVALDSSLATPRNGLSITGRRVFPDRPQVLKIGATVVNFADDPSPPQFSTEDIRRLMFGGSNSLSDYFRANSYGNLTVTGDILGHATINKERGKCEKSDYWGWVKAADQALINKGIDINQYYSLVYFFTPQLTSCRWYGLATLGKGSLPARVWVNHSLNLSVTSQEVAHNLGIDHSNLWDCRVDDEQGSEDCRSSEYGETLTPMGYVNLNTYHMNGPHKHALGFLDDRRIRTVTLTGDSPLVVKIAPLEKIDESLPSILRITNQVTGDFYYVEYKQQLDYDEKLPQPIFSGILIHTWTGIISQKTNLIHPTTKGSVETAALFDGEAFHDPLNRVTIKQLSHDESGATLELSRRYAPPLVRGDISGDGIVDEEDRRILLGQLGARGNNLLGDLDKDGSVGGYDTLILQENFRRRTVPSDAVFQAIARCLNKRVADDPSCAEADLTGDGVVVDIYDYNKYLESR